MHTDTPFVLRSELISRVESTLTVLQCGMLVWVCTRCDGLREALSILLLIVVVFEAGQVPALWSFMRGSNNDERSESTDTFVTPYSAEIAQAMGLSVSLFNEKVRCCRLVIALPTSLHAPLLALHLFVQCVAKLRSAELVPRIGCNPCHQDRHTSGESNRVELRLALFILKVGAP